MIRVSLLLCVLCFPFACFALPCRPNDSVCIAKEAAATKDKGRCYRTLNPDACISAYADIVDGPEVCKEIHETDGIGPFCYQRIAVRRLDDLICDQIQFSFKGKYNPNLLRQKNCKAAVYTAQAEKSHFVAQCDKAAVAREMDFDPLNPLGICYGTVLKDKGDPKTCDTLKRESDKRACFMMVAVARRDCSLFPFDGGTPSRANCLDTLSPVKAVETISSKPDLCRATLNQLADYLDAGDVNGALSILGSSPKNQDSIERMGALGQKRIASGFRSSILASVDQDNYQYRIPASDVPSTRFGMTLTKDGCKMIYW